MLVEQSYGKTQYFIFTLIDEFSNLVLSRAVEFLRI
jgi:hypothetical protein